MRLFRPAALLAALLIGQGVSAQTTDPFVEVTVSRLTPAVTVSKPSTVAADDASTYAGYTVTITNKSSNVLSNISGTGAVTVSTSLVAGVILSDGLSAEGCIAEGVALTCNFGALQLPKGASKSFLVLVNAPTYQSPYLGSSTDSVTFSFTAVFKNGNPTSPNDNSFGSLKASDNVTVSQFALLAVKSVVPASKGGTFFTAENGISTPDAPMTTKVTVPTFGGSTAPLYAKASILGEPDVAQVNCNNFKQCYKSTISIPDPTSTSSPPAPLVFSSNLTIVLRQDASNIKAGTKIESVLIEYVPDDLYQQGYVAPYFVGQCLPAPTIHPADGLPCFSKLPVYYKSSKVPGWSAALDGDFEWTLINIKNGIYRIQ